MSEEPQEPKPPKSWLCPCCKLSFRTREAFVRHLRGVIAMAQGALARVGA